MVKVIFTTLAARFAIQPWCEHVAVWTDILNVISTIKSYT